MRKRGENQRGGFYGPRRGYKRGEGQGRPQLGPKGIPKRLGHPPERPPKENIQVTVDTVIPLMPTKHELLEKPNWDANYKKEYDIFEKELAKLNEEKVEEHKEFVGRIT